MKLTMFLLTFAFLQIHANGVAQSVTLSGKNMPLKDVFSAIRKQTGYVVFGKKEYLAEAKPVTLSVYNTPLKNVLEFALKDQQLVFEISDSLKTIVLSRKPETAQRLPFTMEGMVINTRNRLSLPAATIQVKDRPGGTITDAGGRFKLSGLEEKDQLVVSSLGFHSVTLPVERLSAMATGQVIALPNVIVRRMGESFLFEMFPADSPLDEIVIQGYGTVKKRDMIGTISRVTSKEIGNMPVSNIMSALQGAVPGLEISNPSGTPGAAPVVRLRGINTMNDVNKSVAALVLIDGVAVTDFSYLSPADVESVEVLKDASATAIYGSRGAAGVILITTKRGKMKAGPGRLSFQAYTSITNPTHTAGMLSSEQYTMLRREGFANDNVAITPNNAADLFLDDHVNTNWAKTLYKNAIAQDYQLNFTGGSDKINYFLSGGYRNEDAIVRGNWYQRRINTRMGLDAKVNERLSIGGGFGFSNLKSRDYPGSIASTIYYALPLLPADSAGAPNIKAYPSPAFNPNRMLTAYTLNNSSQFLGNFYFNYNIWDQLYLRTDVSYQQTNGNSTFFSPTTSVQFSTSPTSGYPFAAYGYTNSGRFTVEPQLNYHFSTGRHDVKLLAGATLINGVAKSTSFNVTGFANDLLPTLESATTMSSKTYSEVPYKFASAFGRAVYNYNGKYLLEGVFRRDGSSRFGPNYKYGNFWSAGAGWVFSQEPFLKNIARNGFFGKLKVTYGIAGSDGITDFGYLAYSNTGNYGDNVATYVNNLANPYLQWEETSKLDVGLELSFFNNRLNVSADYFSHRSDNTLFSQVLSVVTGFTSISANLDGIVTNKGLELSLSGEPVRAGSFRWNSQLNLSTLRNKLVSLPGLNSLSPVYRYQFRVGEPLALVWGLRYLGVDPATGLASFEDKDKSNTIASYTDDMQVLGKSIPDFYGGWNNTFTWKNLELFLQTQFVSGVLKSYTTYTSFIGDAYNLPLDALNRWQKPNDVTNVPRAAAPGSAAAINNAKLISSSYAFSDASYIRLKNITLSYTFPALARQRISNLRVFVTGYNLLTITDYKGNDPESGPTYVPVTKMYTAGVNITL
ncbi:SusC/RagA family TonB-linked outer membrane protein [Chitinophaga sp. GCM10012297]|uniref:SusC/RagA family TonB-linked outer membrane protein n=1 Tax=Chitinophaga chungangae TaxID=2821488 RepID=A0ABS3Y7X3_9BACT|nr:SusC/RagA family TonB-linked outer membrane protein [Chitinophaga chungangae]MBO9150770.1 SusC/RagA family TonB-linked outer membrane protein [Chitinophaga chungangae]